MARSQVVFNGPVLGRDLEAKLRAGLKKPGQFAMVYSADQDLLTIIVVNDDLGFDGVQLLGESIQAIRATLSQFADERADAGHGQS
jgi:hypothetical protein